MKKVLILCLLQTVSVILTAQSVRVSGVVTDVNGEPVVGATVACKGTMTGTSVSVDGTYSLEAEPEEILIFSFIGKKTKQISVLGRSRIDVVMEDDTQFLDDVVVIGYGSVNRRDLTTAVSVVPVEDIKSRPVLSAAAALQGKSAGVQVIQPSGTPGAGMVVRIRGNSSINAGSNPLYIVDGVPLDDINHLSPNDIESMQILKDASSAAIYGSRGANGVVLITTKKGANGEAKINFNMYYGLSHVGRHIDALDTEEYREYLKEIGYNAIPDDVTRTTNWFDETFRLGHNQNYQLSIANGNDKLRYYISGAYTDDDGVVPNSSYQRFTLRANIENDIRKWLKIGSNLSYSYSNTKTIADNTGSNRGGVILAVINAAPYLNIWNPEKPDQYDNNAYGARIEPPLAYTENFTTRINSRFLGDVNAEITFLPSLKLKSSAAFDINAYQGYWFLDPVKTEYGRTTHGQAAEDKTNSINLQIDNILTYDQRFDEHALVVQAGVTTNMANWNNTSISGYDFIGSDIKTLNAANTINQTSGTSRYAWRILSFLGRVSYNYNSKYLLTVNFRADGSSKLAPSHRWGYFPSASAAWRISSEDFMKNAGVIDDLKIRVGWGQTGNQGGISEYSYLQQYSIGKQTPTADNPYPGITIGKSNVRNRDLTWETTTQTNIGVDLAMFGNRLNFTADAYYKKTTDMLINVPLPATATVGSILRNEGEMVNKGIEFTISSDNFVREFKWTTDFNMSFNRNTLTKLELAKVYYFGYVETLRDNIVRLEEGRSLSSFYGLKYKYVDPETGNPVYEDLDGDGSITPDDRTYIGCANPKFIYGLTNVFSYKGFSLNVFLQGSYGNDIFNASRADTEGMYDDKNQSVRVRLRWKRPGQIASVPRATGDQSSLKVSSYYVEDGSYLRVKNVTLAYDIVHPKLKKIGISRIQPYFTGQNLLTFTKYLGFDPELNFAGNSSVVQGVDWGTYPNVRTYILGFSIEF